MKEKKTYSLSEAAKEVIRLRDANLIDEVFVGLKVIVVKAKTGEIIQLKSTKENRELVI